MPHLEAALQEYFLADEECRVLCEGPYDYDGYNYLEYNADLFQSITGAWLSLAPRQAGLCSKTNVVIILSYVHTASSGSFLNFLSLGIRLKIASTSVCSS